MMFKEIFGEALIEKGFVFNKNCYIKYSNNVLNTIGVYSQKILDIVEFDIIFEMHPITEPFREDLTIENADNDSLGRIAYAKGESKDIWWEYTFGNKEEMRLKFKEAFCIFEKYGDLYFNADNIEQLSQKVESYSDLLEENSEEIEFEVLRDIFVGETDDLTLPNNNISKKYKDMFYSALFSLRFEYFHLCEHLDESYSDQFCLDTDYVKKFITSFREHKELLQAFINNDAEYIKRKAEEQKRIEQKTVEHNKRILEKFYLL